jgi:hypothetical protein
VKFLTEPLEGKTPLGRVILVYGVLGSILYSAAGLLLDPGNELSFRLYTIGGLIYTVYVTVATYRCAVTVKSVMLRRLTKVSAVATLILLPFLAYLSLSGALTLTSLGGLE